MALIALACAACSSSKETTGTSSDDEQAAEPAAMTAGSGGSKPSQSNDDEPKASEGSAGAPAEDDEPSAGSGDGAPAVIEKATKFDAGSDPDRNKISASQLCERLATINCAGEAFCCDAPNRTVEDCKQDLVTTCSTMLMLDKIAAHENTAFDAAAAEKAFTELEERASKCDPSVAQWGGSQDGLRGILKGTVEPKASCMPPATVDPVVVGAALASCAEPETYACMYKTLLDPWTCEPRSSEGGQCVTDNNCVDGLYCVVQTPGIAGACKPRKEVGESCVAPTECASLFCKKSKCVAADQQSAYCLIN